MHWLLQIALIFQIALVSCSRPSSVTPPVTEETRRIYVSDAEAIFFYNVRSLYYSRTEDKTSYIRSFHYKDHPAECHIIPKIRHAYDRNEAYLILELLQPTDSLTIIWVDPKNTMQGKWVHPVGHPVKDYLFAQKLIQNYRRGVQLYKEEEPLFNPNSFKSFCVVFEDYCKLISLK